MNLPRTGAVLLAALFLYGCAVTDRAFTFPAMINQVPPEELTYTTLETRDGYMWGDGEKVARIVHGVPGPQCAWHAKSFSGIVGYACTVVDRDDCSVMPVTYLFPGHSDFIVEHEAAHVRAHEIFCSGTLNTEGHFNAVYRDVPRKLEKHGLTWAEYKTIYRGDKGAAKENPAEAG